LKRSRLKYFFLFPSIPDLISASEDDVIEDGFVKVRQDSVSSQASLELLSSKFGLLRQASQDDVLQKQQYNECDYEPNGSGSGGAEVLTEISSQGALKVSFVDHRKASSLLINPF
jgi:hypothetical protein